jgi:Ras GTPase-activating-like protein IQGAP2/3
MNPTPYRSSYMASRKADSYVEALSATGKPKLGRHLPRIASGDADETWEEDPNPPPLPPPKKPDEPRTRRMEREKRWREREEKIAAERQTVAPSGLLSGDGAGGVAGLPGRISLKAPNLGVPTPSSRLLGGSWADKQRHMLHAYEYLCHVGEAQQWIEGCLGEELGFGVVEMEDGLRNGVVLARLVRVFQGEASVRRIYEVCVIALFAGCV